MTDASNKTGGKDNGGEPLPTTGSTRSTVSRGAITPALALARHVEWLDFALAAARSEETWRAARLKKATKKTLDKRTSRLAEVRDEIAELAALIQAIRGIKSGAAPRSTTGAAKPRAAGAARPRATGPRKRTPAAPKPRATTTNPAASKPAATKKPAATTKKPSASTTTRRARRPAGPPAKGPT